MRVLVVDDEAPARRRLIRLLDDVGGVEVVGEAQDGVEARKAAKTLKVDLMFLDVRMPRLDGRTLALEGEDLPDIIFVTAYNEYAVAAFEANAVDYLLKPVRRIRLKEALERARARQSVPRQATDFQAILARLEKKPTRVVARYRGTVRLFDVEEIRRFYATDKVTAFRHDDEEHISDESLEALAVRLENHQFLRVHRGELVNLRWVRAIHTRDGGCDLELDDGQRARVSRRSLPILRRALSLVDD